MNIDLNLNLNLNPVATIDAAERGNGGDRVQVQVDVQGYDHGYDHVRFHVLEGIASAGSAA